MTHTYTERDLKIAEELGGLKTLMQATHDKIAVYCEENEKHHKLLWDKSDNLNEEIKSQGKWINGLKGAIAFVTVIFGAIIAWFKHKG